MEQSSRADGRTARQLRPMVLRRGVNPYAEGSVEITAGNTKVLVTVSVENEVPAWMGEGSGGWITAEYGMLPRATHSRNRREASGGKQSGRTLEIQRLIGRAARAALEIKTLPPVTLRIDCDVLTADGGTRTTAITGAWIALHDALHWVRGRYPGYTVPPLTQVAAVSVGMVQGELLVDLAYAEDSRADFDLNVIGDRAGGIIEVQGTAERRALSREQLSSLLDYAQSALGQIFDIQQGALSAGGVIGV